jgi:lysozyme family protein
MSYFLKAIPFVLEHEGGYCHDAHDPGGETKFGICKREYPTLDIANLSQGEAIEIYKRDYWRGYMDKMPFPIAAKLFDASVNMGHTQANRLLQRAANVIDDGIVGHQTLVAINSDNTELLLARFVGGIRRFYERLAEKKPEMAKFLKGWQARAGWIPPEDVA